MTYFFGKFDKRLTMKTALEIDISFEQILELVKKLPKKQKLELSRELEKEGIETKLSRLLDSLKTNELTEEDITNEVREVRQQLYERKKH